MEQRAEKNNSSYEVVVKRTIRADRERVFDAWTKPEIMKQWMVGGPGTAKVDVDLRIGGAYSNVMSIDHGSGTKDYLHQGEYLEILRPERLVFTWNSPAVQNTTVTVELKTVENGTEVTITHQLGTDETHPSSLEGECTSHQQGWTFALEGLAKQFE